MQLSYKILFAVEVLHDYYANSLCSDFEIVPSPETAQLFRDQQVIWKNLGHRGYALVRTIEGKPIATPAITDVFRCYLKLKQPQFANFTNLDGAFGPAARLYFTNLHQTKAGSVSYLSAPMAVYSGSATYLPGALAVSGGNVGEALRKSDNGNPHALNDAVYWRNKGAVRYVTGADLLTHTGEIYRLALNAPADAIITDVFRFNEASGLYDAAVVPAELHNFDTPQGEIAFDLRGLEPGKYRVTANDTEQFIYLDGRLRREQVLGIVEIFNHLPAASDFALLNAQGEVRERTFSIRFANRSAIWKYNTGAGSKVTAIKDSGNTYSFAQQSNAFLSNQPIPFTERPIKSIFLETGDVGPPVLHVTNASAARIKTIEKDGDLFYCSEVYLNY
ncbi:hypothetical protein MKQ68_00240 [Chitinophaga horti]|uniref:Uncharacterized protein n=1 Tax=Chitinophaga horti TaxID=2920382 RepID=A0ABY6J1J0_9BACT|nr:hypothetical protein [Chitinophaga horti]UYQ93528.1 hypothetical protein MKQ68_00240 [Chitinophaga horti]